MTYNPVITLVDLNGLPLTTTPVGDGTATFPMTSAVTLLTYPSLARTTVVSDSFSTNTLQFLAVDITVTSFSGGTSPTIQFLVDRLGGDNVWYNVWSSQTTGTATASSTDLGPGFATAGPPNGSQHAVFTAFARFRSVVAGAPTSVTWSGSVIGR